MNNEENLEKVVLDESELQDVNGGIEVEILADMLGYCAYPCNRNCGRSGRPKTKCPCGGTYISPLS